MPASTTPEMNDLAAIIRRVATREGFTACGFAPAVDSEGYSDLLKWIEVGYAAQMDYFTNRIDAYRHPSGVLPGARSVVVLAWPYSACEAEPSGGAAKASPSGESGRELSSELRIAAEAESETVTGRVARYTWPGTDYHDVIHPKLKRICRAIDAACPDAKSRGIVDTAPLMEREVAQLAGLGWRGKNTLLLNRSLGSYFFLACVLIDVPLPIDSPHAADHCGTCTACLDACPTDAFVSAHVLDASRCISYLTIENRGEIPEPLRAGIGDWLFGCDVCQEVCPWNRKPTRAAMSAGGGPNTDWLLEPDSPRGRMELASLFSLDEEAFRERFRKSPMWRTRRRGLLRNAAIVLGNIGGSESLDALAVARRDPEAIVREAAQWAVQRIRERAA